MNIYVGNLSYSATENSMRDLFEGFGQVTTAKIVTDKFTGSSRGFGFIEILQLPTPAFAAMFHNFSNDRISDRVLSLTLSAYGQVAGRENQNITFFSATENVTYGERHVQWIDEAPVIEQFEMLNRPNLMQGLFWGGSVDFAYLSNFLR